MLYEVITLPDVGGEDIVQRGDILPPGQFVTGLQPLGMLGKHGVHDADERLIAVEETVASGEHRITSYNVCYTKLLREIYIEEVAALPLMFRANPYILPKWLKGVRPTGHYHPTTLWVEEWYRE